jgi:AcrR family transcriptional regulator
MKSTDTEGSGKIAPLRRTQETRSRTTRDKLLQATIDVLMECGYAGLTTAQVDARAGVSSGARVHHYPTKTDLVIAAASMAYRRAAELGQARAQTARTSPESLRHFVEDCRSVYFDWPFLTTVEVVVAARTDAELMARIVPVLDEFHSALRKTWTQAFVEAGYERDEAEAVLRMTLNMIRGMALNRIWENDVAEYERLIETWCTWHAPKRIENRRRSI